MAFILAPTAIAAGYRLEAFNTVGSTNAVALERAAAGDTGPLWLVTDNQINGRGRRGRPWQSNLGNLAATLLFVPESGLKYAATLGFVAGLALADALSAVTPNICFKLKWPNDVLADGAKLSGILLESIMLHDQKFALAIGIGVNVRTCPDDAPYPVTSLAALGASCTAERLFMALSDAWIDNLRLWSEGQGLVAIRQRWLKQAAGLKSPVAMRINNEVVRGIFDTIDDECRFVIRKDSGEKITISAGDVHFGSVGSV